MISTLIRPFTAIWDALVRYHRDHLSDDPDVVRLREQRIEAERALDRVNIIEEAYLPHLRGRGAQHGRR